MGNPQKVLLNATGLSGAGADACHSFTIFHGLSENHSRSCPFLRTLFSALPDVGKISSGLFTARKSVESPGHDKGAGQISPVLIIVN
jgi:hypothetical protein